MAVSEEAFAKAQATINSMTDGDAMKAIGQLVVGLKLGQDNIGNRITNVETNLNMVRTETTQQVQAVKHDLEAEINNRTLNDFWSRQEEANVRCQITFVDEPRSTSNGKKGAESNNKTIAITRIKELIGTRNAEVGYQESWIQHVVRYKQTFRTSRKDVQGSEFDCLKVFLISEHAAASITNMGRLNGIDGFRSGQTLIQSKMFKLSKQVVEQLNHDPHHNGVWKVRNYKPTFVSYKPGVESDQKHYQRPPSDFVPDPYYFLESLRKGPAKRIRASIPNYVPPTSEAATRSSMSSASYMAAPPSTSLLMPPPQHVQVPMPPPQHGQVPMQGAQNASHGAQIPPPPNLASNTGYATVQNGGILQVNAAEAAMINAMRNNQQQAPPAGAHAGAFVHPQYSNYSTQNPICYQSPMNSSFIPPTPDSVLPERPSFNRSVIPISPSIISGPATSTSESSKQTSKSSSQNDYSKKRQHTPGSSGKKTSKHGRLDDEETNDEDTEPETETESVMNDEDEDDDDTSISASQSDAAAQLFQERAKYNKVKKRMSLVGLGEPEATAHLDAIQREIFNKIHAAEKLHGAEKPRQVQRHAKLCEEISDDIPIVPFLERGIRDYSPETVLPPLTLQLVNKIIDLQSKGLLLLITNLKPRCEEIFNGRQAPNRYSMYISTINQRLAREYGRGAPQH